MLKGARTAYSLRLERRWCQLRAARRASELSPVADRTSGMPDGPVLVSCLRDEAVRLPFFLEHYRRLGIVHFLMIDNASSDGTGALLEAEPDVSLWRTEASYKASRFGVDWVNGLLARHGPGRWIVCADADEFLIYPHHQTRRLPALTRWLDAQEQPALGTLLLDIYGKGTIAETPLRVGEDPVEAAPWFDAHNYVLQRHNRYHNLWIQGGPRLRVFFAERPKLAPALNKIPLVRWRKGQVFLTSTHNLLPRRLNRVYDHRGGSLTSGVLLHAKFLDVLAGKVAEELNRREHYAESLEYQAYGADAGDTRLWTPQSTRYRGWRQLCDLGLMSTGGWL